MSETPRLTAHPRTEFGKGAARRARRAGLVPAVLYGHGSETRHLSLPALEFARAIKGGANTVLALQLAGEEQLALARAVVRHPLRDYYEHIDLVMVRRGEKVTVEVPVHLVGDAAPGTLVLHELTTLAIEVDALAIPDRLEVSIAGTEAGTRVMARDVSLPDGAALVTDPETTVVAVQVAPSAEVVGAETDEAAETAAISQGAVPTEEA